MRTVAATRFFVAQLDSFEVIGNKRQLSTCAHGPSVSIDLLRPLPISLVHQQHRYQDVVGVTVCRTSSTSIPSPPSDSSSGWLQNSIQHSRWSRIAMRVH